MAMDPMELNEMPNDNSNSQDDSLSFIWDTMSHHPKYLDAFLNVHNYLMRGEGPLNFSDRHYIAMMAASRHRCPELVDHAKLEIRMTEEEESSSSSLDGLSSASPKLRNLDKLNRLMAHRPWMINMQTMKELVHSEDGKWSVTELMHAILILAHFQSFTSFTLGCAKMEERSMRIKMSEQMKKSGTVTPMETASQSSEIALNDEEETEMAEEALEDFTPIVPSSSPNGITEPNRDEEVSLILKKMEDLKKKQEKELEAAELALRFKKVEDIEVGEGEYEGQKLDSPTTDNGAFTANMAFKYEDFVKRTNPTKYPTVRYHDFNWNDQMFPLIGHLYTDDMSKVLDEKFRLIKSLTYMSIGRFTSVDTTMFRRAVQSYVQCLFGIRHDDYDYAEVNELLARPLKKYIKTVSCYPERCAHSDYKSIMPDFLASEKVHVCLLTCESRLLSSLLYACRALSQFYTKG